MNEQEKELVEIFRKMGNETKHIYLTNGHVALTAQEAVIREYALLPESRPAQPAGGKPAA
jgi:hypothetical protein